MLLTTADLRARLLASSGRVEDIGAGDHVLNPDWQWLKKQPDPREAAVLVPIIDRPEAASVLLTTRAGHLRQHSGQIAFPGGRIDPEDASPEAAALREAQEEVGLAPEFVETIGRLPSYISGTGFRITPVLSIVQPGFSLSINPDEVEDAFEVPLGFLMDVANHRLESRHLRGAERHFYTMPFGDRYIWGVTAGILRVLYERFYA
ncbi:CoA pyrophosphatase [Aureimonas fodinaquatilis]|uniref:CoA pyrophosphatase n=1 Tax=Aureimonas fodinaquatilis TaxID=2565783 RepID=A0A5B0E095_9HYPH|nr:CoA pyrophosphatase [Aureimonas fodinaquatilis]KAA0972048.1 CoA pyrophosphatase [Aureimonas fodinaquatilis]